jgi:hypothetical protein
VTLFFRLTINRKKGNKMDDTANKKKGPAPKIPPPVNPPPVNPKTRADGGEKFTIAPPKGSTPPPPPRGK